MLEDSWVIGLVWLGLVVREREREKEARLKLRLVYIYIGIV